MTMPITSEISAAPKNHSRLLTPTRPTAAVSSMWAMPATRVDRIRGAITMRIRRRNTSVMIDRFEAASLAPAGDSVLLRMKPARTPSAMAARIR